MKKLAATLIFLFTQLAVFGQNKLLKDVDHDVSFYLAGAQRKSP
jgi:hypothetical protein